MTMAVEEIYEPYEDVDNSIPKQQPQSEPQTRTVTKKIVVQLTRFEKYLYITLVRNCSYCYYMLSLKWMRMIRMERLQI